MRFLAFFSRQEMFQQLHVRTASLALLSGNYLALNANQKGAAGQHFLYSLASCFIYPPLCCLFYLLCRHVHTHLGTQEIQSFTSSCKTLLQFMLTMLPESGDNFLPVFRCVHGFCAGEGFLGPSDPAHLLGQMKLGGAEEGAKPPLEKKEGEEEKTSAVREKKGTCVYIYMYAFQYF